MYRWRMLMSSTESITNISKEEKSKKNPPYGAGLGQGGVLGLPNDDDDGEHNSNAEAC